MTKITSIASAVPIHSYPQNELLEFAVEAHDLSPEEERKLRFLYRSSGIDQRFSVLPDFKKEFSERETLLNKENNYGACVSNRLNVYNREALTLSLEAAEKCLIDHYSPEQVTHLITVSCTGMSAPGLDLQLAEAMDMRTDLNRTSVNFMGCYAAVHALKIADAWCSSDPEAKVLIVCTELCTIHFQNDKSPDNLTASLLFGDGSAAVLLENAPEKPGITIESFYSETIRKGKGDMAWQISPQGFLMTLSSYIPDLLKESFAGAVDKALAKAGIIGNDISDWCIHPGGKKILDTVMSGLQLQPAQLADSYAVLRNFGNMSSPAILFVLERIFRRNDVATKGQRIFGAAFGPGLTVETFIAKYD